MCPKRKKPDGNGNYLMHTVIPGGVTQSRRPGIQGPLIKGMDPGYLLAQIPG